jgi:hypothetical protein
MLNGLTLISFAIYGGAVLWQGRLDELVALLGDEGKFLQWAIALAILVEVNRSDYLHPVGKVLISAAIAGLALKIIAKTNAASLLGDVAQGKMGFTDAFRLIVPNDQPADQKVKETGPLAPMEQ